MKNVITIIIALLILTGASPAGATDLDMREHVEAVGTAELKVVPNEFVLQARLTNFDSSLKSASRATDEQVSKLFKQMTSLGVARKYVVTDRVEVNAVTEGYRERGNFRQLGYNVSRGVMVILHDAALIERAMHVLFDVGVARLDISAGHTDMEDLLENAQIQAANAARKKGQVLSSALGRRLGNAVAIAEETPGSNRARNFVYTADTPDLGDGLSLGKIRVRSSVRVKFLLK